MASRIEHMMVIASCSVNKDEVKELSTSGEFKEGVVFCARLEDRQCWVVKTGDKVDISVQILTYYPFKAEGAT